MSALVSSAVAIPAHSEMSPSVPAWFAELTVLARTVGGDQKQCQLWETIPLLGSRSRCTWP